MCLKEQSYVKKNIVCSKEQSYVQKNNCMFKSFLNICFENLKVRLFV